MVLLTTEIPCIEKKQRWSRRITFKDVENRGWALNTEAANHLKKVFPANIWEALVDVFMSGDMKSASAELLLAYLLRNSEFFQRVKERPSDAYIFNYLYRQQQVENEIDRFFPLCKSAVGIYQRLMSLRQELPKLIYREIKRQKIGNKKILIDNIGCGDAPESIMLLVDHPELVPKVNIRCIDNDPNCLERVKKHVRELGISESFEFVCADIQNVCSRKAHIIISIGVFCPIPSKLSIKMFEAFQVFSRSNGIVVFSTVQKPMIQGDPLCDLIMRMAGWCMSFKADDEPRRIIETAGWKPEGFFDDSMGYNRMTIARYSETLLNKIKRTLLNTKCLIV